MDGGLFCFIAATYPTGVKPYRGKSRLPIMGLIRWLFWLVVAVGIGYLVIGNPSAPSPVAPEQKTAGSGSRGAARLLLLNDSSATLICTGEACLAPTTTRMTREEFEKRFPVATRPVEGANAANGSAVTYGKELRSPDHVFVAQLVAPKTDGASVIEVGNRTLVLRLNNRPLRDARVHGWADAKTMFVSAIVTSTRAIVSVGTDGTIRELAPLPDNVLVLEVRNGAVWYVTASPGEGIESDPVPPSELHRVTVARGDDLIVRDDTRLILSGVPGPDGRVAVYFNDGTADASVIPANAGIRSDTIKLEKRHPLVFLADGNLVMRDNFDLVLVNPKTGETAKIGTVPEGTVEVYEMPRTP